MDTICEHKASALRKRAGVGGIKVQRQCDACLRGIGESVELSAFPPDQRLRFRAWKSEPQPNSKSRAYAEHLRSPEWKATRLLVLERDDWTCRSCGEPATDVHHVTYERFGEERLEDLAASCKACNVTERTQRLLGGR